MGIYYLTMWACGVEELCEIRASTVAEAVEQVADEATRWVYTWEALEEDTEETYPIRWIIYADADNNQPLTHGVQDVVIPAGSIAAPVFG